MTNWALRTDHSTGRVAFYETNGASGDPADPNSTLNKPLNNLAAYFDKAKFHSDADHMEVALAGTASITHALIAGHAADPVSGSSFAWDAGTDDQLIASHSLGYPPFVLVALGNNILWPGMPVDTNSDGGGRYASVYATTTEIRLFTTDTIGVSNLPAVTNVYSYLVFKDPPAAAGHTLIGFTRATGVTQIGKGKFSADRRYLQVVPGGSPLDLVNARSVDLNNGAPKSWRADLTSFEPVPANMKTYFLRQTYGGGTPYTNTLGAALSYAGSYAGPGSPVQVQAP